MFSINSTNSCKGLSLLLLLWHHLFYQHPDFGHIVYRTALLSNVCIALFVILSGYGFSESIKQKTIGLFEFYKRRLSVIYSNYWFIALIFVPVGIVFMNRAIQDVFTDHAYAKFIIQMIGLHRFAYPEYGYNITWWYMSVIIPLIILFPFIYDLTQKYGVFILSMLLIIVIPDKASIPVITTWLLPFALGIYFSQRNYITTISRHLSSYKLWRFPMLIIAIMFLAAFRTYSPLLNGNKIDWLFGGLIILFIYELTISFKLVEILLSFLGKHLFNIFLFHTFIYYYYWEAFIYSFKYPVLIFLVLLSICIVLSIMIEFLKKYIHFYELVKKFQKLKVPVTIEIAFQGVPADSHISLR